MKPRHMISLMPTRSQGRAAIAVLALASIHVHGCRSQDSCDCADDPRAGAAGMPIAGSSGGGDASGGNGASGGTAGVSQESGFVTWTYRDATMGLYLPEPTGKPLPVLTYLHACNNDPVYSEYWIIAAANAMEPTAVFLPTAPPGTENLCADWGGTYDDALRPNMVNALAELDRLIEKYAFDAKRQYLYGESMGGEGVFKLLVEFPTRFTGAVAVAGYTLDAGATEMAQTPLWIFHGEKDSISPVENDRAIYQAIVDAGGTSVKYTEYPGLDHVPGIEEARTEAGLFDWLMDQRRQ